MAKSELQKMADAIVKSQDESGLWWQVLDRPEDKGNYLEGSVSSMFTYFLLKSCHSFAYFPKPIEAANQYNENILFVVPDQIN